MVNSFLAASGNTHSGAFWPTSSLPCAIAYGSTNAARRSENNNFFIIPISFFVYERYNILIYMHNNTIYVPYRQKNIYTFIFVINYLAGMKIKKVQLSEKDKRKAYRTAVRKASQEAGLDKAVSYTHLRAHETRHDLVCRLL